jgi:adenosylcobinamide kinase / adenosylcobinamide-phosphate guanylyltransferase
MAAPGYVLLLGGVRSGKSRLAVDLAERSELPVAFLATAEAGDDDMAARIERHRTERPTSWTIVEEPIEVAAAVCSLDRTAVRGTFLVVDCLTLWVANLVFSDHPDERVLDRAGELAVVLAGRAAPSVVVSNEVGLGLHPETPLGRRYRDLLGAVNRVMAEHARRSLLLVAGRALRLEDPHELLA